MFTVQQGLTYDPYSAKYLAILAQYYLAINKKKEGLVYYQKLKKIVPKASIVKQLADKF